MAYLAGAWLILQVADTVIPWLGLGDAVGRILLVVLVVGFVPVVIATWLFEWTPDGIRFDDEVEVDAAGAVVARRRLDRIIIGILAIAVIYFAVDEFLFDASQSDTRSGDRSIAVLPFEDISPDGDQGYLGSGIADELRLELQYLEGLRVAGRTSSNAYAQEDGKTIGETLDVETILEGSVRKEGDNVRITVQLTNAADGFTIWSESYNRKLEKIFEMQEEIAIEVAGRLGVSLGVGGVNAFHGAGTQNIEAYETYLRARVNDWGQDGDPIPLLERAIQLDPNYAVAWSALANWKLAALWDAGPGEAREIVEGAHELALRGAELDPESAAVQSVLALIKMVQFEFVGSEQGHSRAIELLGDRPTLEKYALMLIRTGRIAYAQKQIDIGMTLEPLGGRPPPFAWHASLAQGMFAEAQERSNWQSKSTVDIIENNMDIAFNKDDPEELKAAIRAIPEANLSNAPPYHRHQHLNLSYTSLYGPLLAEFDSPERVLSMLRDVYQDESLQWPRKLHDVAMAAAYFDDPRFALQAKVEDIRNSPARMGAIWYPVLSQVRRLPEFKDFATDFNLLEYWRAYGWADACEPLGDNDFTCS